MHLTRRLPNCSLLALWLLLGSACTGAQGSVPSSEAPALDCPSKPAACLTLPGLLGHLEDDDFCVRVSAALALAEMGEGASSAVSLLTSNLYVQRPWEMRSAAAYALGQIGSASKPAVPVLIAILLTDFVHVQSAAAEALGRIGDRSAVPALALALRDGKSEAAIDAAEALMLLTGEQFPGLGGPVYDLNDEGLPLGVVAAQQWWDQEGRYESWITR